MKIENTIRHLYDCFFEIFGKSFWIGIRKFISSWYSMDGFTNHSPVAVTRGVAWNLFQERVAFGQCHCIIHFYKFCTWTGFTVITLIVHYDNQMTLGMEFKWYNNKGTGFISHQVKYVFIIKFNFRERWETD